MKIVFKGPVFYSEEDENHFFKWIYSLPSYAEILGKGIELHLSLNEPTDDETIIQLLIIFRRWCINTDVLKPLKRPSNESFVLWEKRLQDV